MLDEALITPLTMFPIAFLFAIILGYVLGEGGAEMLQTASLLIAVVFLTAWMGFVSLYSSGFGRPITDSFWSRYIPLGEKYLVVSRTKLPEGRYALWVRTMANGKLSAFELPENPPDCFVKTRGSDAYRDCGKAEVRP